MFGAICNIIVVTVLSDTDRKHLNILKCVYIYIYRYVYIYICAQSTLPDKAVLHKDRWERAVCSVLDCCIVSD